MCKRASDLYIYYVDVASEVILVFAGKDSSITGGHGAGCKLCQMGHAAIVVF